MLENRLHIANLPTPIRYLENISESINTSLYVKRDDFTGLELSGNKIRKLEFIMKDVLDHGYDTVITCGGIQSNHARTTAYVANQLGLNCHLILSESDEETVYNGNYFLNDIADVKIEYVNKQDFIESKLNKYMNKIAQDYNEKGKSAYCIPLGASNFIGNLGYMNCIKEIKEQLANDFLLDRIVVTVGSGGTYAGLLLGIKQFMPSVKLTGINVRLDSAYFKNYINTIANETIDMFDLDLKIKDSDIDIIDGYVGAGYGIPNEEELEIIRRVVKLEGILLDPTYTGKAAYGFYKELMKGKFDNEKILFIHTGGQLGVFGNTKYFK